jgi:hypothetical protein
MKGALAMFLGLVAAKLIVSSARSTRGRRRGDDCFFPVTTAIEVVWSLAIAMGASLIYFGVVGPRSDRVIVTSIGTFFVLTCSLTWPKSIWLSELAARQRSWYGSWKTIPWTDLQDVKQDRDGSVVLCGTHRKIRFSTSHGGQDIGAHLTNVRFS